MAAVPTAGRPETGPASEHRPAVRDAVEDVVRSLVGGATDERDGRTTREIRTDGALYALSGQPLRLDDGTVAAVVTIERRPPTPPPAELVRAAFGLTRREAQVAAMLAKGRANAEIAEALRISPHTARHHTQNVLLKLGVRSRTRVADRLMTANQYCRGTWRRP